MKATQIEPICDKETATLEFERWLDANGLEFYPDEMDLEDAEGFNKQKNLFVRKVMEGALVVNEDGTVTYNYVDKDGSPKELTFYEPEGSHHMSMDRAKKGQDIAKKNILMGAITKTSADKFAKMRSRDLKICDMLLMLFLV